MQVAEMRLSRHHQPVKPCALMLRFYAENGPTEILQE